MRILQFTSSRVFADCQKRPFLLGCWAFLTPAPHSLHCARHHHSVAPHSRRGALGRIRLPQPQLITTLSPPRPTPHRRRRRLLQAARTARPTVRQMPGRGRLTPPRPQTWRDFIHSEFRYRGRWRGSEEVSEAQFPRRRRRGFGAVRKGSACRASYIRLARRRPDHGNALAPFTSLHFESRAQKRASGSGASHGPRPTQKALAMKRNSQANRRRRREQSDSQRPTDAQRYRAARPERESSARELGAVATGSDQLTLTATLGLVYLAPSPTRPSFPRSPRPSPSPPPPSA